MCPRTGVPYPERVLCSLKNKIAMIEQKLGLKIEKINGVGPDPSGNVTIVSGDAALTIEEEAVEHTVIVGLDRSKLPSAAVTSVNGKTGAVVLDAGDIADGFMGDVATTEADLYSGLYGLRQSVTQERQRAENAESTLQNNINTLQASLPAEAAAAVAANPTVAQLTSDVTALQAADGNNVKLSGNQSISGVKTVATETTGVYSQQIANSQKVKNELDAYSPMVRTTGNRVISGNTYLEMSSAQPVIMTRRSNYSYPPATALGIHTIASYLGTKQVGRIQISIMANGITYMEAVVLNSDGTEKIVRLATGDSI